MNEQTDKMNYCCDCGWAVKKGLFCKTWYCTCPEVNYPYPVRDYVTGELALNFDEMIPTKVVLLPGNPPLMPSIKTCEAARHFEQGKACPHFEEKPYAHPRKNPLPCLPLPERVEKAMEKEKLRKFDPMIDEDSLPPEVWTKAVCDDKSCIHRAGLGCDRKWIFITEDGNCGKRMTMDEYQKYMGFKVEEEKGDVK